MAIFSAFWSASASRRAPLSMSAKQLGSGRKSRIFGSRWRARSSRETPRASKSSSTSWSSPALSSGARRQRHGCPVTDRSTLSAKSPMTELYPGASRGPAVLSALPDVAQQLDEPLRRHVERLAAGDPLELDRPQLVAALLVLADDPRFAAKRRIDRIGRAFADQREVGGVGGGRSREISALLDQHLVRAERVRELLGEPLAGVDLVEVDVAERVARHDLARR